MSVIHEVKLNIDGESKTVHVKTAANLTDGQILSVVKATASLNPNNMHDTCIKSHKTINNKTAEKYDRILTLPETTPDGTVYYKKPEKTSQVLILSEPDDKSRRTIYTAKVPEEVAANSSQTEIQNYLRYVVRDWNRMNPAQKIENPRWPHIVKLPAKFLKNYAVEIQAVSKDLILTMTQTDMLEPGDVLMNSIMWCYVYLGVYEGRPHSAFEQPDKGHMYLFLGDDDKIPIVKLSEKDLERHVIDQISTRIKDLCLDPNGMFKAEPYGFIEKLGHVNLNPIVNQIQSAFGTKRVNLIE